MRLVRLKPQGPGPIGARTARYNENFPPFCAPKFIERKMRFLLTTYLRKEGNRTKILRGARSRFQASGPRGTMIRPWLNACAYTTRAQIKPMNINMNINICPKTIILLMRLLSSQEVIYLGKIRSDKFTDCKNWLTIRVLIVFACE